MFTESTAYSAVDPNCFGTYPKSAPKWQKSDEMITKVLWLLTVSFKTTISFSKGSVPQYTGIIGIVWFYSLKIRAKNGINNSILCSLAHYCFKTLSNPICLVYKHVLSRGLVHWVYGDYFAPTQLNAWQTPKIKTYS